MALFEVILHLFPGLIVVEVVDGHQMSLESDHVLAANIAGSSDDTAFVHAVEPVVEGRREKRRQDDFRFHVIVIFAGMILFKMRRQISLRQDLRAFAAFHFHALPTAFLDMFFDAADAAIRLDFAFGTGIALSHVIRGQVTVSVKGGFESVMVATVVRARQAVIIGGFVGHGGVLFGVHSFNYRISLAKDFV